MAEILGNYDVLKKFDQSFKQTISKLYIFGNKGENVIIVNSNDDVIVFGDNTDGMLGLGHTNAVLKPTKIHQLCGQNIIEFSNGITHVTALSADGKVYGWGQIETMPQNENFKPKLLSNLNGEKIKQICCGFSHSFALSESGKLFAWGSNKCGQLGLGDKIYRSEPIQISGLRLESITEISSGSLHSMALTSSGQVFIWGFNNWENSNNGKINEMNNNNKNSSSPYLLNVENNNGKVAVIKKIVCGSHHSVLLSEERDIYTFGQNYCSQLGNGNKRHRNNPGLIKLARKFIDIAASHHSTISIALSEDNVYYIWGEYEKSKMNGSICVSKPTPCDLKSFHAIFTHYCKPNITYRTVDTSLMSIEKSKNSQIIKKNKYREEFREKGILGTGSFSIVCKARSNVDKEFYAIKIIPLNNFKGLLEETKEFRELKIMQKLRSDLVVQYTQHWIEENYTRNDKNYFKRHQNTETLSSEHKVFDKSKEFLLHIQMELCCKTLRDIIKQLNIELNQKQSEVLTPIGYYIASELLVEILESVDYLHSQKPPIIHRDLKPTNILITQGLNDSLKSLTSVWLQFMNSKNNLIPKEREL
jgi:alpha-tubulin suppressor-like RCC1 family protein